MDVYSTSGNQQRESSRSGLFFETLLRVPKFIEQIIKVHSERRLNRAQNQRLTSLVISSIFIAGQRLKTGNLQNLVRL